MLVVFGMAMLLVFSSYPSLETSNALALQGLQADFELFPGADARTYNLLVTSPGTVLVEVTWQPSTQILRVQLSQGDDFQPLTLQGQSPLVIQSVATPDSVFSATEELWRIFITRDAGTSLKGTVRVSGTAKFQGPLQRKSANSVTLLSKENIWMGLLFHQVDRFLTAQPATDVDKDYASILSGFERTDLERLKNQFLSIPLQDRQKYLHPYALLPTSAQLTWAQVFADWAQILKTFAPPNKTSDPNGEDWEHHTTEPSHGLVSAPAQASTAFWRVLSIHMEDQQERGSDEPYLIIFALRDFNDFNEPDRRIAGQIRFLRTLQFSDVDEECGAGRWTDCAGGSRCGDSRTISTLREFILGPGGGTLTDLSTNEIFNGRYEILIGSAHKAVEDDDGVLCVSANRTFKAAAAPFAALKVLLDLGLVSVPPGVTVRAVHEFLRNMAMPEALNFIIEQDHFCEDSYGPARSDGFFTGSLISSCIMVDYNMPGRHLVSKRSISIISR
jgi:hypothetical protein